MLERQLEPELMDDRQEAIAYDEMDHSVVNRSFVDDLLAAGPIGPDILDLGTGTARIPIELCRRVPECRVLACDGAISMLEIARYNIAISSLDYRIQLHHGDAKRLQIESETFDAVISNSLLHHLPDPAQAIAEIGRLVKPGGRIFVRDLCRPHSLEEQAALVGKYALNDGCCAQKMFAESLAAALSLQEIQALVLATGRGSNEVTMTSDRHWTWASTKVN